VERHGIPTVSLFTQAFAGLADAVTRGQQAEGLRRVVLPHPLNDRPEDEIRAALRRRLPEVVAALTRHGVS
jgi:hypothetical protein